MTDSLHAEEEVGSIVGRLVSYSAVQELRLSSGAREDVLHMPSPWADLDDAAS